MSDLSFLMRKIRCLGSSDMQFYIIGSEFDDFADCSLVNLLAVTNGDSLRCANGMILCVAVTSDVSSDELLESSKEKMYEFSAADGFVEINESMRDMIKCVANEPSVGLFYIQQHAQHGVPNVISLENNIAENSRETLLQAEDLEDSITMVRSMKECGFSIADEMIIEIKRSLAIMSTKQPIRGLIRHSNSSFQIGGSSWSPSIWGRNISGDGERMGGYLSSVMQSAKQKAGNIKWPRIDLMELREMRGEELGAYHDKSLLAPSGTTSSTLPDEEVEELPLSSRIDDDDDDDDMEGDASAPTKVELKFHHAPSRSDNYDMFRADREARLEEWLEDRGNIE